MGWLLCGTAACHLRAHLLACAQSGSWDAQALSRRPFDGCPCTLALAVALQPEDEPEEEEEEEEPEYDSENDMPKRGAAAQAPSGARVRTLMCTRAYLCSYEGMHPPA